MSVGTKAEYSDFLKCTTASLSLVTAQNNRVFFHSIVALQSSMIIVNILSNFLKYTPFFVVILYLVTIHMRPF